MALNLTVADAKGSGYATAYPDGTAAPATSNVNFSAGQVVPNVVIVKLGADGSIDLKNGSDGTVDFIADLEGYYAFTGLGYGQAGPARLVDTRQSKSAIPAGGTLRVHVTGSTGNKAVVLNVTVTDTQSGGYLTAYPDGAAAPTASNLNFIAKQTVANEVVVEEGADGYVDFKNASPGSVDLVVDRNGEFGNVGGAAFVPLDPTRVLDTRKGIGKLQMEEDGTNPRAMPPYSTATDQLSGNLDGPGPVPSQSIAVAANLTAAGPTAGGYLTAWDADTLQRPTVSTINFGAGQFVANAATIQLSYGPYYGMLLYNGSSGSTPVVMDVFGYYEN